MVLCKKSGSSQPTPVKKTDSRLLRREFNTLLPSFYMTIIASSVCTLINGLIVGNFIGTTDLAAVGIAAPFTQILAIFYSTVSSGSQAVCCQYIGRGDKKKADAVFSTALFVSGLLGLLLTVSCVGFAVPVARLLGADASLAPLTARYIRGLAVGFIPCLLNPILMTFIQMGSHPKKSIAAVVLQTIVNLSLDYLFIIVMHKSLFYASLASSLGAMAALIYLGVTYARQDNIAMFRVSYITLRFVTPIFRFGFLQAVTFGMCAARGVVFSHLLMSSGGADAASAWSVMLNVTVPIAALDLGTEQVCEAMFSVSVGEKDSYSVRQIWNIMLVWGGLYI
ncbi:MAG TPA: hypothetical protein DDY98_04130, partial [Ruminococcaceae bacterium]|nr:hypothetical protein [Oscillospiraceae bacterium]